LPWQLDPPKIGIGHQEWEEIKAAPKKKGDEFKQNANSVGNKICHKNGQKK
jgi:hypothetical protein